MSVAIFLSAIACVCVFIVGYRVGKSATEEAKRQLDIESAEWKWKDKIDNRLLEIGWKVELLERISRERPEGGAK